MFLIPLIFHQQSHSSLKTDGCLRKNNSYPMRIYFFSDKNEGLTLFRKEWLRIGSSAARETLLSMMKTRMRLVKMW